MNAELRVVSGKHSGNAIPLPMGRFLIGREEDCHLRPNSDLVSRHHCVFHTDDYTLRLRDLGSTNGTLVNGERLRGEVVLNTGDKVAIGQLEFEVQIREEAPTTESLELGAVIHGDGAVEVDAGATIVGASEPSSADTMTEMPVVGDAAALHDTTSFQNDTVLQPVPDQYAGYGQQPMGYPMPYPPMAYPYGMPMMGYPQAPMQYPMGMYPQQPMQAAPMPQQAATENAPQKATPEVNLPDPTTTGAKPPAPPAAAGSGGKGPNVTDTAGQIIKQYLHRRPPSQ